MSEQEYPQELPAVWLGVTMENAEGPTSTLARGEASTYTFGFTIWGVIRMLLLPWHRDIRVKIQVLDIELPPAVPCAAVVKQAADNSRAQQLIDHCFGLIECFENGDTWTPEARKNAVAGLYAGIKKVSHG